jgi:hypothetical protein
MSVSKDRCGDCRGRMPRPARTGRPRVRCGRCAANKAALGKAWRASHPREVAAYNARRRAASQRAIEDRAFESHLRLVRASRLNRRTAKEEGTGGSRT